MQLSRFKYVRTDILDVSRRRRDIAALTACTVLHEYKVPNVPLNISAYNDEKYGNPQHFMTSSKITGLRLLDWGWRLCGGVGIEVHLLVHVGG